MQQNSLAGRRVGDGEHLGRGGAGEQEVCRGRMRECGRLREGLLGGDRDLRGVAAADAEGHDLVAYLRRPSLFPILPA